ncbi:MAG: threonine 3-dehydrogenase [Saprospiraceae bacterium]|jgi:threonine 3-dehydrogenase
MSNTPLPRILVTGANGQIGSDLVAELRRRFGKDNILASDIFQPEGVIEPFGIVNILDKERIKQVVEQQGVTQIYHLAAILSARGEQNPLQTWEINMQGLFNILEVAKDNKLDKVFFPSSIAVFGNNTPAINTPQHTVAEPTTVYGMSKIAGENWCQYYHEKYGLDIRSVRYPGIIGHGQKPGGGTTDYAVDIYHKAVNNEDFECFLSENTALPMLYMEDAINGTIDIMEAPVEKIKVRTSYNLAGMSFTPAEIYAEIQKHYPNFKMTYKPDFRQAIADSWTDSIDDSTARSDWGWQPKYDLAKMTEDMIMHLKAKG